MFVLSLSRPLTKQSPFPISRPLKKLAPPTFRSTPYTPLYVYTFIIFRDWRLR
jgi:hypothetical protein